jgi:hypothetical protein
MSMFGEKMDMSKGDPHEMMMAMMQLKHNPKMLKALSAEKVIRILKGVERLARIPFVDQDALFDLQLKLTLHLLDLQIMRLHTTARFFGPSDHKRHPVDLKPHSDFVKGRFPLPHAMIAKIDNFQFFTPIGCQLNQSKVARQNAMKRDIFVGPCQADDEAWSFNVWKLA